MYGDDRPEAGFPIVAKGDVFVIIEFIMIERCHGVAYSPKEIQDFPYNRTKLLINPLPPGASNQWLIGGNHIIATSIHKIATQGSDRTLRGLGW